MTRFTQGGAVRVWVSGQGKKSRVPRQMILKFSFDQFLNTIFMKKSIVYDGRETQDIELQQDAARDAAMLEFLTPFITDERRQRFEEILDFRTRHITVVLEDIFQPHNASAVLRTCDLRGILSHSLWPEADQADAGEYVHLPSADNRGSDQRMGRDGHPFLAEGPLHGPDSRRSGARQQEPRCRLEVID